MDLVGAYDTPEPAVEKALALLLEYQRAGDAAKIMRKYTLQVKPGPSGKAGASGAVRSSGAVGSSGAAVSSGGAVAASRRAGAKAVAGEAKKRLIAVFDIDDTLIRDRSDHFTLNPAVVRLFQSLVALGVEVHLVTARLADAETTAWTRDQLAEMGIAGYASLRLAPDRRRGSLADVSKWKMEQRRAIARAAGAPIVLTVGDQWGDMVTLDDDAHIDLLDVAVAPRQPWKVVRPNDGVSLWGLKLRSFV